MKTCSQVYSVSSLLPLWPEVHQLKVADEPMVLINQTFGRKIVNIFLPISLNICLGLIEMVLLSTQNICFG